MSWVNSFGGRRAIYWSAPLVLVALNLFWLSVFGSGSRVRLRELERRLESANRVKGEVSARLQARERLWIDAAENRSRIEAIYRERFATERSRFTEQVRELKSLAERAGLDPATIAYPEDQLAEYGLIRRSFAFSVQGSYDSLRNFLHLLELSSSFLSVDQIAVNEARGGLGVKLRLSTLFEAVRSDADAAARDGLEASLPASADDAPAEDSASPEEGG